MSYAIIGCASRKSYGPSFETVNADYRYINDVMEQSTGARQNKKESYSKAGLPEPLFVANAGLPIEDQLPYMGTDKRLKEINDRHAWEQANRVREIIG